jgi:hypothetical protein
VIDKLGIKPGCVVAFDAQPRAVEAWLRDRVLGRAGRQAASAEEWADVVLVGADVSTDAEAVLRSWKSRIEPVGGIWLLTPKRHLPGYVNQTDLIQAGLAAGLVDNKTCSVSDTLSGIRFVVRKSDRQSS